MSSSVRNDNLWDDRRPKLNHWWETPDNHDYRLSDTMSISSEAKKATKLWLHQRLNTNKTQQINVSKSSTFDLFIK